MLTVPINTIMTCLFLISVFSIFLIPFSTVCFLILQSDTPLQLDNGEHLEHFRVGPGNDIRKFGHGPVSGVLVNVPYHFQIFITIILHFAIVLMLLAMLALAFTATNNE